MAGIERDAKEEQQMTTFTIHADFTAEYARREEHLEYIKKNFGDGEITHSQLEEAEFELRAMDDAVVLEGTDVTHSEPYAIPAIPSLASVAGIALIVIGMLAFGIFLNVAEGVGR